MNKLVVFGDSWSAGAELADKELSFPHMLGNILGKQTINLSEPGSSIDEAVFYLLQFFENSSILTQPEQFTILFCLTAYSRTMLLTSGEAITQMRPTDSASEKYYKYFYQEDTAKFNLIRNLILIQHICNSYKIPVYFVFNWDEAPRHALLNNDKIYHKSLINILGMTYEEDLTSQFVNCEYIGECHPNIAGHELIAKELSEWIN